MLVHALEIARQSLRKAKGYETPDAQIDRYPKLSPACWHICTVKLPVGWRAVPRYERLAHSRVLKPVDGQEVWSVPCFFVAKKFRRQGINVELLKAAVAHVKSRGGKIVEGYPVDGNTDYPPPFAFTGTASAFVQAGFTEVARNSPTRPIFRYVIES
jgi:GNAT superfamily N-acetyltransferase